MKIKSGFILRDVCGQKVVVAIGERADEFNGIITLNNTGVIIWKAIEDGLRIDEIVDLLMSKFEAERAVIDADVKRIVKKLKEANIIDD